MSSKAVDKGNPALLVGVAGFAGRRSSDRLYVSCVHSESGYHPADHKDMLSFDPGSIEGPTEVGDDFGRVEVSGEPEFHVNAGYAASDDNFSTLKFEIDEPDLRHVLDRQDRR